MDALKVEAMAEAMSRVLMLNGLPCTQILFDAEIFELARVAADASEAFKHNRPYRYAGFGCDYVM